MYFLLTCFSMFVLMTSARDNERPVRNFQSISM